MRARNAALEGSVTRDGVRVVYDVYDNDGPTVLLMPTWSIVHSRHWKAQVPYLSRHFRVVTFDGRGNGRSDRPTDPACYADSEFVSDAVAVLEASGTERAVVAGVSLGGHWAALLAGLHPRLVEGAILIGPVTTLVDPLPERGEFSWDDELTTDEGWAKYNKHYWQRDHAGFAEWFFAQALSEPHSSKQREDAVGWALETDATTLVATGLAEYVAGDEEKAILACIRCPVLIMHGTDDRIRPYAGAEALATLTGAGLLTMERCGHLPHIRHPVVVNRAISTFVRNCQTPTGANP